MTFQFDDAGCERLTLAHYFSKMSSDLDQKGQKKVLVPVWIIIRRAHFRFFFAQRAMELNLNIRIFYSPHKVSHSTKS